MRALNRLGKGCGGRQRKSLGLPPSLRERRDHRLADRKEAVHPLHPGGRLEQAETYTDRIMFVAESDAEEGVDVDVFEIRLEVVGIGEAFYTYHYIEVVVVVKLHVKIFKLVQPDRAKCFVPLPDLNTRSFHRIELFLFVQPSELI